MDARSEVATGYTRPALRKWAAQAHEWSGGGQRDVFVYFTNGAKERAPAAAMQLLRELAKAR